MKIIVAITLTNLVTNSFLSSFCPFLRKKQELGFQQAGDLVTINISVFCL